MGCDRDSKVAVHPSGGASIVVQSGLFAAAEMPFVAPEEACNITPMAHVLDAVWGVMDAILTPIFERGRYSDGSPTPFVWVDLEPGRASCRCDGVQTSAQQLRRDDPSPGFRHTRANLRDQVMGGPPCLRWNVACRVPFMYPASARLSANANASMMFLGSDSPRYA